MLLSMYDYHIWLIALRLPKPWTPRALETTLNLDKPCVYILQNVSYTCTNVRNIHAKNHENQSSQDRQTDKVPYDRVET